MISLKAGLFLVIISLVFSIQFSHAQKFVIPILPDTQNEVWHNPEMYNSQMKWIADNKTILNIPIVIHVGDIIKWETPDKSMWKTASNGFKILDKAKIPYVITPGNHDCALVKVGQGPLPGVLLTFRRIAMYIAEILGLGKGLGDAHCEIRDTRQFNEVFPVKRFIAQRGRYENGKSDNAWYIFKAGDLNWMVLALEFCPRQGAVDWANKVISDYPDYNVIIVTHYHLTSKGLISENNAGYGDLSPKAVYDQLVRIHPNVRLVVSGHVDSSSWRDDIGIKGNHIYQLLQDYQEDNLGGGFIRLLEIDTKSGTISARMYSPYSNQTKKDLSYFTFSKVDFIKSDLAIHQGNGTLSENINLDK
ncbi:MAG: metallophosphoesterase [Bacteroidetes bacterium]|nr:metallophosphoesterase [Bacteroidota bacterium]